MSKKEIGYRIHNGFVPHLDGQLELSGFENTNVGLNELKRRGKVVICTFSAVSKTDDNNVISGYISAGAKIIIPEEFRPKKKIQIPISCIYLDGSLTDKRISTFMYIENGAITMTQNNIVFFSIWQVGWEIE